MTDEEKGGSGSGTGDAKMPDPKNRTAKQSMDAVMAENVALRQQILEKDALMGDLTKQLEEANNVLEGQQKSKLIGEIMARSNFKMDELVNKSVDDLQNIRATLDQAMLPKINSTRVGVLGLDVSDREKGLTVGDMSVVTAAKRKAAAGAV